jgi:hypothetical protein
MPTFQNLPGGFPAVRKKMIRKMLPLMIFLALLGLLSSITTKGHFVKLFLFYGLLTAAIVYFSLKKVLRHQHRIYDSYILNIRNESISCVQFGQPEIIIPTSDITRIVELKDRGLLIVGKDPQHILKVPAEIPGYYLVKEQLLDVHPMIYVLSRNFLQQNQLLLSI